MQNEQRIIKIAEKFNVSDEVAARIFVGVPAADFVDEDYEVMFAHYCETKEMPYEVATSGDPYVWIAEKLSKELGIF